MTSQQPKTPQIQGVANRLAALSIQEVASLFGLSVNKAVESDEPWGAFPTSPRQ